jgi:hypothetical protein
MAEAQKSKLLSCFDQVARDDERSNGILSTYGLQLGNRSPAEFRAHVEAGIRDAVFLYNDHGLIVRTPPNPGLGTLAKVLLTRSTSSIVPHLRFSRADVRSVDVTGSPPPGLPLIGAMRFLRITTERESYWHWIDETLADDWNNNRLNEISTLYTNLDVKWI